MPKRTTSPRPATEATQPPPPVSPPPGAAARLDAPPADCIEEVVMDELGGGKWRVRVLRAPLSATTTVRVLEDGVSLPVARGAAISWRQRNGGIGRGIR